MKFNSGYIVWAMIVPLFPLLYIWFRVVHPRKNMKPIYRLLYCFTLIFFELKPLIFLLIEGSRFFPRLSPFFTELSGIVFFALVIFAFGVLVRDILILLLKNFSARSLNYSPSRKFLISAFVTAFALSCYGTYNAHLLPIVTEYTVESKHLSSSFDGLRIAYIADIHAWHGRGKDFVQSVVDITNKQKCQLVLLGGDYLDGSVNDMGDALLPLKDLHSKYGTFAVPGNHEYYFDYVTWKKFFEEKLNIPVLINQHKFIEGQNGQIIFITGISDISAQKIGEEVPNVRCALPVFGFPVFNILLSHRPDNARENNRLGIDLQLSGHTHGGFLPVLSKIVGLFNNGFVVGQYKFSNMTLIVSRGAGYAQGLPTRIMNPAEIVVVTLKCKK